MPAAGELVLVVDNTVAVGGAASPDKNVNQGVVSVQVSIDLPVQHPPDPNNPASA
jgi:hypothetical protein